MKKLFISMCLGIAMLLLQTPAKAQANEIAQLLLNVEKLSQFKQILKDMETGYTVLKNGYGTIKNISEGNFNMHQLFLDGLWAVSPTVKQYGKIADIINDQVLLVKEYKAAYNRCKNSGLFVPDEISYLEGVYSRLLDASLQNLDELTNIVTANKLRMSDDERIRAIDRLYANMENKLQFLRSFNNANSVLAAQRKTATDENQRLKKMSGIK